MTLGQNPDGTFRVTQEIYQCGRWSWACQTTHGIFMLEACILRFGPWAERRVRKAATRQARRLRKGDLRRLCTASTVNT